jgi:vacuolar-type H+-ATPase catalytic subunit A/Vma1
MNELHSHTRDAPLARLEASLIDEYLRIHGYDRAAIAALTNSEREALLSEASRHASGKLSEVELRSQFVHGLHERRLARFAKRARRKPRLGLTRSHRDILLAGC